MSQMRTARATGTLPAELVQAMMAGKGGPVPTGTAAEPAPVLSVLRPPLVTAVLVVSDVNRLMFARAAVGNFMAQTYANKHLVIVNGIDPAAYPAEQKQPDESVLTLTPAQQADFSRVTNREHPWITEQRVRPGLSVGAMRNLALAAVPAPTEWVALWDDDNFSHPSRIAFQMAHRIDNGTPVLLRKEIRVDVVNAVACPHENVAGIHSTLIFPLPPARSAMPAFPDKTGYEDAEFWIKNWGGRQVVVPNIGDFPHTVMQVAFWHGRNVTTREQFFGPYADPKWFKKAEISRKELDYFNSDIGPAYGANFHGTPTQETKAG